ncbi:MAG: dihydroorotase [Oscillochloridaceae bacterium umkhey_bin13]
MRYLIRNGSIIDPARRIATVGDVLVTDGLVERVIDLTEMNTETEPIEGEVEVINARGAVVAPGFTDLHCHLREPGEEHRETLATGTAAAAAGGFTTICAMPTTDPCLDTAAVARQIQALAQYESPIRVDLIGALTRKRAGQTLADLAELAECGCIAFSEGGRTLGDANLMRNALAYAAALGLPVMVQCEDPALAAGAVMHEGVVSTRLGLPGVPAAAEETIIARELALAELTGARLHLCQVSTAGSVALIRAAKARGMQLTAEVSPHHLTLTDQWVMGSLNPPREKAPTRLSRRSRRNPHPELGLPSWLDPRLLPPYDPSTRMRPPLRTQDDVEAVVEGLRDGTLDVIASGHTPLALVDTRCEYGYAVPGISSLETALALVLTLVHRGELDLVDMVAKLTEGPAQVLGRSPATLHPGARADLVIFDPDRYWNVTPETFVSRGHNTPLAGQRLKGQVMLTMAGGKIVFRRDNFGQSGQAQPAPSRLDGILEN